MADKIVFVLLAVVLVFGLIFVVVQMDKEEKEARNTFESFGDKQYSTERATYLVLYPVCADNVDVGLWVSDHKQGVGRSAVGVGYAVRMTNVEFKQWCN